jgi:hypothetical protein
MANGASIFDACGAPRRSLLVFAALLASSVLQAQTPRGVNVASSQFLRYTTSQSWAVGERRIEFRIHNLSVHASNFAIFDDQRFYCLIQANTLTLVCGSGADSTNVSLDLSGLMAGVNDIRVRVQRSVANQLFSCEVWRGDGSRYTRATNVMKATVQQGYEASAWLLGEYDQASGGGVLDFFRVYSSLLALNSRPPAEAPLSPGDLTDFRFEGTLNDSSPQKVKLSNVGGSISYVNSPVYPPVAVISPIDVARASFPSRLDASLSFDSLLDDGNPSIKWEQEDGPFQGSFSKTSDPNPLFTAPVAGSYTVRLTVRDAAGATATVSRIMGVVATDRNGVLIPADAGIDRLIGPLTRWGTSPWPYYDIAEKAIVDSIAPAALANPPSVGAACEGTITVLRQPVRFIGNGTKFSTCLTPGTTAIVGWDTVDGPQTGRLLVLTKTVADDTHADMAGYDIQIDLPQQGKVFQMPQETSTFVTGWWGLNNGGANSWNYYDTALAIYRVYFRTGMPAYLKYARQFADYWWEYGIDHGRAGAYPRLAALTSQYLRALDGHPERFPDLRKMAVFFNSNQSTPDSQGWNRVSPYMDVREAGYAHWAMALGAKSDPDHDRHAAYCSDLARLTPQWISGQNAEGYWSENTYAGTQGFPYKPPGTAPWRMAIAVRALEDTYEALADTSPQGCNAPDLASQLLPAIGKAINFIYKYGRSSTNRGVFYYVQYASNGNNPTVGAGTVSVNRNATEVSGSGTNFNTLLACNGTDYIAFDNSRTVYLVKSCSGPSSLTLVQSFGSQNESSDVTGSTWQKVPPSPTNCGASLASACFTGFVDPPAGDRNLTRTLPATTGWMYYVTGDETYRAWGDEWFSASFGGPAGGPGTNTPCGGPACDGLVTDYAGALANCTTNGNTPPCFSGGGPFYYLGKNFGEGSGATGAQNHLAYRLGRRTGPELVSIDVPLDFASYGGNAVSATVLVTQPSGATSTVTCTASPCTVVVDARQGNHMIQVTYLAADGTVVEKRPATSLSVSPDRVRRPQ